jgi:hypothetical protein
MNVEQSWHKILDVSGLWLNIPVSGGKFLARMESSRLGQKAPGYAHGQISWKILPY